MLNVDFERFFQKQDVLNALEEFEAIFEQAGIPIIRKYSTEEK